jgi:signal transduction histidine kinase
MTGVHRSSSIVQQLIRSSKEGAAAVRERAEQGSSAPPGIASRPCSDRADAVARLAWIAPGASSLVALGRGGAGAAWPLLCHDPGAVLLLVRHPSARDIDPSDSLSACCLPALLEDPALVEEAHRLLSAGGPGFVDWRGPEVAGVYRACLAYARRARRLAGQTGLCDAEAAWACGLLAPLGWLALCALDPPAVAACLADSELPRDPAAAQRRLWGMGQAAASRRLARRWGLPRWVAAIAGDLALPAPVAIARGAPAVLFRLIRLAVATTPETGLHLAPEAAGFAEEDRAALGLGPEVLAAEPDHEEAGPPAWDDPRGVPLLRDLLAAAAENRRLRARALHVALEQEVDDFHHALAGQARTEARRLRDGRLEALAEFAAGAGHEINNPLAVISGQAQYLLGHATEWFHSEAAGDATRSLQTIIGQARRVHGLLRDLMVFARPGPATPAWFDLPALLGEVAASLAEWAAQRKVCIDVAARPERLALYADPAQLRQALGCLLRNAVEAAGPGGWARLGLRDGPATGPVEVTVQDSGPGPDLAQRAALFDPFFSGRSAGRGRGLGLPIAWRLARQQGGDVRLEPGRPGEPTCFVLSLPRHADGSPELPATLPGPSAGSSLPPLTARAG